MLRKRLIRSLMTHATKSPFDPLKSILDSYIAKIYNKAMEEIILEECLSFDWDEGNHIKNLHKHMVSRQEAEEVFFNVPLLFYKDLKHSKDEKRMYVLGRSDADRKLFIAFTIRNQLIRVISARDMHKKEREMYERA